MQLRTRSRLAAVALAGVLAVAPVAGAVALAPAAAADEAPVTAVVEIAPISAEIDPVSAELDDAPAQPADELDPFQISPVDLMIEGAILLVSLSTIVLAGYFLFFRSRRKPVRKNA